MTSRSPPNFVNVSYGISRMRKGLFVFHAELATGYKNVIDNFYEHKKCGLVEIDYLQAANPWHVVSKRSPFKEIFKVKSMSMAFSLVERSRRATDRPTCQGVQAQNFESVRIIDCYAAFLVLCYGIGAAFLIFCIEFLLKFKRFCKKNHD